MRIILSIIILNICFSDEYPYFLDIDKQFRFENKRIYVKEEEGERTLFSGGDSYTELANPWGYLLLDQSPAYISKNHPITTTFEYWYKFTITQNNIELTEIDFLRTTGLHEQANSILKNYSDKLNIYNNNLLDFEKKNKLKNEIHVEDFNFQRGWIGHMSNFKGGLNDDSSIDAILGYINLCIAGLWMLDWYANGDLYSEFCDDYGNEYGDCDDYDNWKEDSKIYSDILSITVSLNLSNLIKWTKTDKRKTWKYPEYRNIKPPKKPKLKQTLSADQIYSISESYNKRIFNEIKEEEE